MTYLKQFDGHIPNSQVTFEDIIPRGAVRDLTKKRENRLAELRKQAFEGSSRT